MVNKKVNRSAVFLDRDGTIIYDRAYLRDPAQVQLIPGAGEALSQLQHYGLRLVLASNQSGIAQGFLTLEDLKQVHQQMITCLARHGVVIDTTYYCEHAPWESCECRKPLPGMLLQAAKELNPNLQSSFMVGDKPSDIKAGKLAGCKTILFAVELPSVSLSKVHTAVKPDYVAPDWSRVTKYILNELQLHSGEINEQ